MYILWYRKAKFFLSLFFSLRIISIKYVQNGHIKKQKKNRKTITFLKFKEIIIFKFTTNKQIKKALRFTDVNVLKFSSDDFEYVDICKFKLDGGAKICMAFRRRKNGCPMSCRRTNDYFL